MQKETNKKMLSLQPVPNTIVSVRDKNGCNNALVVGFAANALGGAGGPLAVFFVAILASE